MSDDFIVIVARDPTHVPSEGAQLQVSVLLSRLAPSADSITAEAAAAVRFYDCGGNFERISCPHCRAEIGIDWWQERMDEDFDGEGFRLENYDTPCCGTPIDLNALIYDWPQAFGCFSWTIQNANIGELTKGAKAELEAAAGVPIVVIHQHL
jgi:hypothetical protein